MSGRAVEETASVLLESLEMRGIDVFGEFGDDCAIDPPGEEALAAAAREAAGG